MRAVQVKDYGDIDEVLGVAHHVQVPRLSDGPPPRSLFGPYGPFMIIKVLSVSLSPGDWRTLSGKTRSVQRPKSFPYVPGGDCCGVVVELPNDNDQSSFKIGDRVAVRFTGNGPKGALGEYAMVDMTVAEKVPDSISSDAAAALASASWAVPLAEYIHETDKRVLILGAGGGIGSHVCQLLRQRGVDYIVGVSNAPNRLLQKPLSYDEAIDYTKHDIFSLERFQKNPFDMIIDLSCGGWPRLVQDVREKRSLVVKPLSQGGRYVTTLTDNAVLEVSSMAHFLWKALHPALVRSIWSRVWTRSTLPSYTFAMLGPEERIVVTKTLELADKGVLEAALDERGPFEFTTEGVRKAFHVQESRHVHGKVVIHVADD